MEASDLIIERIKGWEGLRLRAYRCPAGVWTIGYGHTGSDVKAGAVITRSEADALFDRDVGRVGDELNRSLASERVGALSQHQFDALVSFAYNLGIGKLRGSTLWKKVCRNPADPTIGEEFGRWVYATVNGRKEKLAGLVRRRELEASIYMRGDYGV